MMITNFLEDPRIYCYIVCVNDGFYMEPDVSVFKVFLDYKKAKKCCELQRKKHRSAFIEKKLLYYD